jgi:hypothetical protein
MAIQTAADSITSNQGSPYGFKNRVINGGMAIDQRNAGVSVTPSNSYTLDRWQAQTSQSSKYTVQQNAGSVTPPTGYANYLGVTSSSAYSLAAGDYFSIRQAVEGFNIADLGWGTGTAKTVTLSFWVYSSLGPGTFGGSFQNNGNVRSYPFTYTVNAQNTWEYKTITIPGDTSGTWATNSSVGTWITFSLGMGSTYSGTAGAWVTANYNSVTGATSVVGTSSATWYITGVQLEVGQQSTAFDYRDYGRELILCQRYCPAFPVQAGSHNSFLGMAYGSSLALWQFNMPVTPRVVPTGVTYTGTATNLRYYVGNSSGSVSSFAYNDATYQTGWASSGVSASNAQCLMLATPTSESGVIYFTGCEL